MLFALAVQVVQVREPSLGWLGVAVVGVVCGGLVGMGAKGERERSRKGDAVAVTRVVVGDLKRPRALLMLVVFVVQVGILVAMLGIGGRAVVRGGVDEDCPSGGEGPGLGGWSREKPLPVDVVGGKVDNVDVVVTVTEVCCGTERNTSTYSIGLVGSSGSSQSTSEDVQTASQNSDTVEVGIDWVTTTTTLTVTA